jgi:5-methylcytosine-specific restriction protein B
MSDAADQGRSHAAWFVGAMYGGTDDQTPRFLTEGIWQNGYDHKLLDIVRSMRPGERIAIKSSYTRRHGLPFDNRGQTVSVMAIKAVGTITENLNDGRTVRVNWTKVDPPREWYFFTGRSTLWRVFPGEWTTDGLIGFTFNGKAQDLDRFCNAPNWRERFGSVPSEQQRFQWTRFYEAVADKLLAFRSDRAPLIKGLAEITSRVEGLGYLAGDRYADGSAGFLRDVCPFTVMGMFNRGTTDANRKIIAAELARFLGVDEPVPQTFEGIPILNNMKSWFFPPESQRQPDHIDALWRVFAVAIDFADSEREDDDSRTEFAKAFDNVNGRHGVAWNLTFGLYWIRPWSFLSLDHNSRLYITRKLGVPIERHGPRRRCNAADYLSVMAALEQRFQEASYSAHSYPELSFEAWRYKEPERSPADKSDDDDEDPTEDGIQDGIEETARIVPIVLYGIDDILQDGCFLESDEIERLIDRLRTKKNLILQGPPGTGKTWIAKRLAFALMGQKDESKIRAVQFHPNLSYEDFVRGWRPAGDGKLSLVDGVFMDSIKAASKEASSRFVVVIEEINRGNPAQIFGELLTLLEAGKRTPNEALELSYPDADGNRTRVHIPENLYVIGTMNIADRSLALVDLAFRRRFAFVTLEPKLGAQWRKWVVEKGGVDSALVDDIERRLTVLNQRIASDLGNQFRIGHSYVTPTQRLENGATRDWFRQIVETEIGPLLEEYWFDSPSTAREALDRLIEGW